MEKIETFYCSCCDDEVVRKNDIQKRFRQFKEEVKIFFKDEWHGKWIIRKIRRIFGELQK